MNNGLRNNIIAVVEELRTQFNNIASLTDESNAYHELYKTILKLGETLRLCNVYDALKENKPLLDGFKTAYCRSDKIMLREYLSERHGDK